MKRLLLAGFLLGLSSAARAEDVGGMDLTCVNTAKERAEVMDWADRHKFVVRRFDPDTSTKIVKALNEVPPVSHLVVDDFVSLRGEDSTVIGFDIGPRFCLYAVPVPNGAFDKLVDDAVGKGL